MIFPINGTCALPLNKDNNKDPNIMALERKGLIYHVSQHVYQPRGSASRSENVPKKQLTKESLTAALGRLSGLWHEVLLIL